MRDETMRQKGIRNTVVVIGLLVIIVIAVVLLNTSNKNCESINDPAARDDCYHAIAHKTHNRNLCDKIFDTEKKEHCYDHVPD